MEPLPGIAAFTAVFERVTGARLEAAERFVRSLPGLFPGLLVGCDLASRPGSQIVVVVMRFAERQLGPAARRRLEFWCGRAGVRSTALETLADEQRAAFFANLEKCDPKLMGVSPDAIDGESARFFTQLGAPADRKPVEAGPVLSMDVGGPGSAGVRYVAAEATLFVPGVLSPPAGDELAVVLRVPGRDGLLRSQACVVGVRDGEEYGGAGKGFGLALVDPPPELVEALAGLEEPARAGGEQRLHQRYAVKAPVLVTPYVPPDPDAPPQVEVPLDEEERPPLDPFPSALIEYATEQELAADYVDNLSQGGAFVRTSRPSPAGTRLTFSMRLPGGDELTAPATVVGVSEKGMGLKFELPPDGQQRLAAAIARISARPRRALVVDDDGLVRRMLQDALQQRGFEVLTAADGVTGLSLLAEELLALDLLITDIGMPNMDGHAFIRTIRNAGGESDLAIVVVTGALEGGLEKRLEREGADAVLDKELGPELIAQAADAVLERKRIARGGT